ncbi:hypothetical protein [Ferrovibrio terrae]|uniref:hypothetical protein n=1 Tax=Ferrovibrio terrae TaxID=2594003 RepID=UPI003137BEF2
MLSGKPLLRIAVLLALAIFLPGCAQYHCMSLPEREQCYAAYDDWRQCQNLNRHLIRQVGSERYETCTTERDRCDKKGKNCRREREVCRWESRPIYDYSGYNAGVSQCMRSQGLAAYDDYFNRPLFATSLFSVGLGP